MSLDELNIETTGFCRDRPLPYSSNQRARDVAYDLSSAVTPLNATTADSLFLSGIPDEFAILVTVRVEPGNTAELFSIMDGDQKLSFRLNPEVEIEFRQRDEAPARVGYNVNITDGRWHRVAFALKKKHVSLALDCEKPKAHVRKPKNFNPNLGPTSVIFLGPHFQVF